MRLENLINTIREQSSPQEPMTEIQKAGLAYTLKERLAALDKTHTFKRGDLIQQKPGLKMYKSVVAIALEYEISEKSGGVDKDDLVVGWIDSDGDMIFSKVDSRRYEPYTGKTAEEI